MERSVRIVLLCVFPSLLFLLLPHDAPAVEVTGTLYYAPPKSGSSTSPPEQSFVCYELNSKIMLDCFFHSTMQKRAVVPPWKMDDGHSAAQHVEALRPFGNFYVTLADLAFGYTVVTGQTRAGIAYYNYFPSEVAGYYQINVRYQFPHGFYCIDPDCLMQTYLDVGMRGLDRLPDTGPDWVVLRGGTAKHPDANWLRSDAKATLIMIARIYHGTSGRLLSINDMSLPLGGMFDLDGQYSITGGHASHRGGTAADINTYGGAIPCRDDTALKEAINDVNRLKHYAKLKCEDAVVNGVMQNDWRKHIDFN